MPASKFNTRPFVTPDVPVLMVPVIINESLFEVPSENKITLADSEIAPDKVFFPLELYIAPKLLIPVPDKFNTSGIIKLVPTIFKAVPADTVVVEAPVTPGVVLPNASWFSN